jgi:indole-3-glycerol phosphate synthase
MPSSLDQIIAATRRKLADSRRGIDPHQLELKAEKHVPRGFRRALQPFSQRGVAVIAELKKASPSKGLIRSSFDPASLANELEAAGAAALSVLTNEEFFQGSLHNLHVASEATNLPCLRKDFIVDEIQILEARANRADAILLIVAALSQSELKMLTQRATACDLDVLCEVHDLDEIQRAADAGCNLIGVNARDLHTFKVDLETALGLADSIPSNALAVAESGIHTGTDIARLRAAGFQAFLIGECLMSAESPGEALRALISNATENWH